MVQPSTAGLLSRFTALRRNTQKISSRSNPSLGRLMVILLLCTGAVSSLRGQSVDSGGAATSRHDGQTYSLGNEAIDARWNVADGKLLNLAVTDRENKRTVSVAVPFTLLMADGTIIHSGDLHFEGTPEFRPLDAHADASRFSDRIGGKQFEGILTNDSGDLQVDWSLVLRDGSPYIRQVVKLSAPHHDLAIHDVRMIDLHLPGARRAGSVSGTPIVDGNFYFGFEHPQSSSDVIGDHVVADLERTLPLPKDRSITYSSVIGIAPPGQMRRAFLNYIERERAHPYRTFLHYNSWFDIGYFSSYDETAAVHAINAIGEELHDKRGVTLDSYLFDDGWDNHSSLWSFNSGFPDGFKGVSAAAEKYGAHPGVWLSPWGGYGKPKQERIQYGKQAGFEIVDGGFALSGPKYYERFRDVCFEMMQKYGINQFKFDGTGNADHVVPGSHFDNDFDAMLHLIGELREKKPDVYINLTTGTYASPFWLFTADSIWRGGEDSELAGVGTKRERWITYRDADTYAHVVTQGPLFPLNSLMLHGIIYAKSNDWLNTDPGNDFANEVHSYFGTGTQLQELYLTPSLLNKENWDTLAESAKWSRENADVLKDTHWVGGDPAWLEVYGWAAWSPKKATLVLRNPADKPQSFTVDLAKVLELPPGAAQAYSAKSPWKADAGNAAVSIDARKPYKVDLQPFEVLTLDLQPK